ncbi:MAG: DUF5989 family protein [bacterium]|nr:DUF5989 family protein [bacterium]
MSLETTTMKQETPFSLPDALALGSAILVAIGFVILPFWANANGFSHLNDHRIFVLIPIVAVLGAIIAIVSLTNIRMRPMSPSLLFIAGVFGLLACGLPVLRVLAGQDTQATVIGDVANIGFYLTVIGFVGFLVQSFIKRPALPEGVSGYNEDIMSRLGTMGELMRFLWKRKLYWMMPMIIVLFMFAALIIAGSAGGLAPFIYTLW